MLRVQSVVSVCVHLTLCSQSPLSWYSCFCLGLLELLPVTSVVYECLPNKLHASCQAVSDLLEHHTRQFGSSMKDILDPKKLSAGAGLPASGPEGSRSGHGHATTKWQVRASFLRILKFLV